MHERLGEALSALHFNDLAMVYNASDPDLVARKDKYYYSIKHDDVRRMDEAARARFDVDYCLKKARQVLGSRNVDADMLDWALHLAELSAILKPDWLEPKYLVARALMWKGERDAALKMMEDIREAKPEKFVGGNDEDAWYQCNRSLGDLYLADYNRPDLAIPCFQEFRKSPKSGADTLFKLGQAYEAAGDVARAIAYFEQVTGYTEHPKYYEAQEAVRRLKG
jgi:tetratricopeptide (TPR) repeat protein